MHDDPAARSEEVVHASDNRDGRQAHQGPQAQGAVVARVDDLGVHLVVSRGSRPGAWKARRVSRLREHPLGKDIGPGGGRRGELPAPVGGRPDHSHRRRGRVRDIDGPGVEGAVAFGGLAAVKGIVDARALGGAGELKGEPAAVKTPWMTGRNLGDDALENLRRGV